MDLVGIGAALRRSSRAPLFTGPLIFLAGLQCDLRAPVSSLLCFSIILVPTTSRLLSSLHRTRAWNPGKAARLAVLAGVSLTFLLVAFLPLDRQERCYLEMLRSNRARDWPETIDLARRLEIETYHEHPSAYAILHRALFHTGRLPYDLLYYPVDLLNMEPVPLARMQRGPGRLDSGDIVEMCMELGLLNYAELMAYDALDTPEMPGRACELLVLIYIVKDNPEAAMPMLGLLEK